MKRYQLLSSLFLGLTISFGTAAVLPAKEPVFEGLGSYSRKITTESSQAQRYFDQGLGFYHGFNHSAAIRAFKEAARLDPKCAMAHWAIALANGPHINFPLVPPPAAEEAWKELQLAQQNAEKASPVERALIEALGKRYANPQPEDRKPLDEAYAAAMREVWKQFPNDQDVGALFAEAMMDLRPWDQWTPDGQPNPGTDEILATLDAVIALNQNHPFANHLYIHAVEASRNPERADPAADRLRTLQPGLAHNVHMPSHIDIRRGRWQKAIETNEKAIGADKTYRKIVGPPTGLLPVYAAHNRHMLAYGALMTGQRQLAMKHVRAMVSEIPAAFVKESPTIADGFFAVPMEVLVRFGRWDEILAEPKKYPKNMPFSRAFHHAARATAYAAKGNTATARKEQTLFLEGAKLVPAETQLGNNLAAPVISLASHMLEGEILVAEGNVDGGVAELQTAVKEEDALKYDEPPAWMIPVRHSLGAVLMKAKRFAEAEQVYRDDLARLPDNGWSLFGLAESLREQKKSEDEAAATKVKFQNTWAKADVKITTSCLCQAKKQ
jgi:tetratricopeptide (TPR) repeat protein